MAESLLIRIPDTGVNHAEWAVLDDHGQIEGGIHKGELGDITGVAGGRKVTVVVSGEDVVLTEAEVPGGNLTQARKAIPFSLEESLAQDVDDLHFAVGKPVEDNHYPVAVVSRARMEALQAQLDDAGINPSAVVPEPPATSGARIYR